MTTAGRQELIEEAAKLRDRHNFERTSGDRVAMSDIEERLIQIRRELNGVAPPQPAPQMPIEIVHHKTGPKGSRKPPAGSLTAAEYVQAPKPTIVTTPN